MQNNTSKIIIGLLVVLILLVGVGIIVLSHRKDPMENTDYNFPTSADITNGTNSSSGTTAPSTLAHTVTTTPTQNPPQSQSGSGVNSYSNAQDGFSFKYPSDWILSEDSAKHSVKISTKSISVDGVDNAGNPMSYSPDYSITFTKVDKNFFNPPINTKYGQATYDQNRNSVLIDGECRVSGIKGTSLQGVTYGGSNMSSPAYGDSAVVTTNKDIIIIHTEQGSALSNEILDQIKTTLDSFALLNGNKIFIPICN